MSVEGPPKLVELLTRLYKEVGIIETEERAKGNVIDTLWYVLTPADFKTLMTDKTFKAMAEGRFPNPPRDTPIPNIGGSEVVENDTIETSKVEYTVVTIPENRKRRRAINQRYRY